MHLNICNIVLNRNECCVSRHIFNANTIHVNINKSLPNELKMCRISTSNVSCGSGEMVSGATGGEFW